MKKMILFLLFIPLILHAGQKNKPILKTGTRSYLTYSLYEMRNLIYPYHYADTFYLSLQHPISPHFSIYNRLDFNSQTYLKNAALSHLNQFQIGWQLKFKFTAFKILKIDLYTKPVFKYKKGIFSFEQKNQINLRLNTKLVLHSSTYSFRFDFNEDNDFYHQARFYWLWQIPAVQAIKYKATLSLNWQHALAGLPQYSCLKKTQLAFELIIDFNKMDLKKFYEYEKDQNDYFLIENNEQ